MLIQPLLIEIIEFHSLPALIIDVANYLRFLGENQRIFSLARRDVLGTSYAWVRIRFPSNWQADPKVCIRSSGEFYIIVDFLFSLLINFS